MTPRLRSTTVRQIIRALERDGWTLLRSSGSHQSYTKQGRLIVVPYHHSGATLPPGTLTDIVDKAGWTDDDLRRLKLLK